MLASAPAPVEAEMGRELNEMTYSLLVIATHDADSDARGSLKGSISDLSIVSTTTSLIQSTLDLESG